MLEILLWRHHGWTWRSYCRLLPWTNRLPISVTVRLSIESSWRHSSPSHSFSLPLNFSTPFWLSHSKCLHRGSQHSWSCYWFTILIYSKNYTDCFLKTTSNTSPRTSSKGEQNTPPYASSEGVSHSPCLFYASWPIHCWKTVQLIHRQGWNNGLPITWW